MTTVPRALQVRAHGASLRDARQRNLPLAGGEQSRLARVIGLAQVNLIEAEWL